MQPVEPRAATCDPRYSHWVFKGLNFLYNLQLVSRVALVLFLISILPAANFWYMNMLDILDISGENNCNPKPHGPGVKSVTVFS